MAIKTAKVLGATGIGGTGGYFSYDYAIYGGLTKWDKALVRHLRNDGDLENVVITGGNWDFEGIPKRGEIEIKIEVKEGTEIQTENPSLGTK